MKSRRNGFDQLKPARRGKTGFRAGVSVFLLLSFLVLYCGPPAFRPARLSWQFWQMEEPSSLRGISAPSELEAWVCGSGGFCVRTTDAGKHWRRLHIPGADSLDFRDVHAFPGGVAYLMSAGEGSLGRVFKTRDGGATWETVLQNPHPEGFFSGMAFWDERRGMVLSDPVGGRFRIFRTDDGGMHWRESPAVGMPPAVGGEYAFAASGQCVAVFGKAAAVFVSGGARARIFFSPDGGVNWSVRPLPLRAGSPFAGAFATGWLNERTGIVVGGDYRSPAQPGSTVAVTDAGWLTWRVPEGAKDMPYLSTVIGLPFRRSGLWFASGPEGTFFTADGGEHWRLLIRRGFHVLAAAPQGHSGWAAGAKGAVARFVWKE